MCVCVRERKKERERKREKERERERERERQRQTESERERARESKRERERGSVCTSPCFKAVEMSCALANRSVVRSTNERQNALPSQSDRSHAPPNSDKHSKAN